MDSSVKVPSSVKAAQAHVLLPAISSAPNDLLLPSRGSPRRLGGDRRGHRGDASLDHGDRCPRRRARVARAARSSSAAPVALSAGTPTAPGTSPATARCSTTSSPTPAPCTRASPTAARRRPRSRSRPPPTRSPAWAATPPAEKARLFFKAAEIVRRRRAEIAEALARETGSTIPSPPSSRTWSPPPWSRRRAGSTSPRARCWPRTWPDTHSIRRAPPARRGGQLHPVERREHPRLAGRAQPAGGRLHRGGQALRVRADLRGPDHEPRSPRRPASRPGVVNVVPHAPGGAGRDRGRVLRARRRALHQPDRRGAHRADARPSAPAAPLKRTVSSSAATTR
jgi:hypothetical protein